jgi:hypothetical protein
LEVAFAVMIVSVALLGLNAAVSGAIDTAGDSINRRAAREQCRAKLEEILAGTTPPDGGGDLTDYPSFSWSARTEELMLGVPDQNPTEKVRIVIVEVRFPLSGRGVPAGEEAGEGMDKLSLASVLPEEPAQPGAQPQ